MIRTYTELMSIKTFSDRFEYLREYGRVGGYTFGDERYLNQSFYKSRDWLDVRREVIVRDRGHDLGMLDPMYEITHGKIIVHHMNPLLPFDILHKTKFLLDPEYLITVSHMTHEQLTYGVPGETTNPFKERSKNDTCPWKL